MHTKWNSKHSAPENTPKLSKIALAVRASIVCLAFASGMSQAAEIVVTSNRDDNRRNCTLREAIVSMNRSTATNPVVAKGCSFSGEFGDNDTITFANRFRLARNNTITLAESGGEGIIFEPTEGETGGEFGGDSHVPFPTELYISNGKNITIDASNIPRGVTIDADGHSRVLNVANSTLSLNRIVITGGTADSYDSGGGSGGGIYARDSVLSFNESTISNNNTLSNDYDDYIRGGGLSVESSTVTLSNSTVSGNLIPSRNDYSFGGGVNASNSTVSIYNSSISENKIIDGFYSKGGGIHARGSQILVVNSEISYNEVLGDKYSYGSAIYTSNSSITTIENSLISLNKVGYNYNTTNTTSGTVHSQGMIKVENSSITLNNHNGIFSSGTMASINSTISENSGNGITGSGIITINNSTISENRSNGVISPFSSVTINNSTISDNERDGIDAYSTTISINNSTISENSIGIHGSARRVRNISSFNITNSIVSNSSGGHDCYLNPVQLSFGAPLEDHPPINIDSASIIEDGNCGASRSGDPGLGPLADNGGPTLTHALTENSIARNTGSSATCPEQDQRGFLRNDGQCDVGAFEISNTQGEPATQPEFNEELE